MVALFPQTNSTTMILLSLAEILLAGFILTRLTKLLKLPNVTGFILAGVVIGPYVLNLVPREFADNMGFISDIALAFIAFGVGRFFKKEVFRETGGAIFIITIIEALAAGILVTLVMHGIFNLPWDFCLLLGAIGTATAPASTMVTIRQYHARGNFVNTLLQVVAFDDAVCLIVFSVVVGFVGSKVSLPEIILPIAYNIGALSIGFIGAVVLSKLVTPQRSEDNRLILTIALLLGIAGFCARVNISPLLSCMFFGAVYINLTGDKNLFVQLERFGPPILAIFFVVSGMRLDIGSFFTFGVIGSVYFLVRIGGKYLGAYWGCRLVGASRSAQKYLGLALIPQAGVAIGLAFLGERILPAPLGNMLLTIILSSSVLYELIGPAAAKYALMAAGSIKTAEREGEQPVK